MSRLDNTGMAIVNTTGKSVWYGNGYWGHPWLIRNVRCPDGRFRTAYLGEDADTFFSWPARVKYAGRWHTGFVMVTTVDNLDTGDVLYAEFYPAR